MVEEKWSSRTLATGPDHLTISTSKRMPRCSGITRIESLQKIQNRAARIVSGSPYDAPSVPLCKKLGWLSIKEMIVKETSTMMYKSLNDLTPQYLKVTYSLDYQISTHARYETLNMILQCR